jgi:WD40 repeat protein
MSGHTGWVVAVAWGVLDGIPVLASAGFDATVRLWDPQTPARGSDQV